MPGVQVELSDGPFQFDARKPHCGRNTSSESSDQTRISVAIFLLKRRSEPCLETHETLRSLGFNIVGIPGPSPRQIRKPNGTRMGSSFGSQVA